MYPAMKYQAPFHRSASSLGSTASVYIADPKSYPTKRQFYIPFVATSRYLTKTETLYCVYSVQPPSSPNCGKTRRTAAQHTRRARTWNPRIPRIEWFRASGPEEVLSGRGASRGLLFICLGAGWQAVPCETGRRRSRSAPGLVSRSAITIAEG